ncbi:MAG: recombinase family protein [Promicromonosporaceae bacterium]|nr:recombinase family protein [Promicromonosporaceae bacterium]
MAPEIAVIYGRQSKDKKTSIEQQIELGSRVAAENAWTLGEVYSDGSSASRFAKKGRADWDRLLGDLRADRFGILILWEPSRGDRDLPSWVTMLAECRERGIRIYVVTAERLYDCRIARDWKTLVEDGTDSAYESEKTSLRSRRDSDKRAVEGRPHGQVAYGYRRVRDEDERGRHIGSHDEIVPEEAEVIRETARRVLAGESMRSVVKALNERGMASPKGVPWSSTTLRQVMLRDRNAGLRRHRGKVVGKAAWEPIYDEDTHARVVALLTDPARTTGASNKGATRKHLLSGIARCGRCGHTMRVVPGSTYKGKVVKPKYQCTGCYRVGRQKDAVEGVVVPLVVERLTMPDGIAALAAGRPERAVELHDLVAGAQARLDLAADGFADGTMTADQVRRINAKLIPQVDAWRAELATCAPHPGVLDLAGPDAAERWAAAPLEVQRAVVETLMVVTILPTGSGGGFDERSVRIEWVRPSGS